MDIIEQIEKLEQLRDRGTLSESEFQAAKQKLLHDQPRQSVGAADVVGSTAGGSASVTGAASAGLIHGVEEKTWCTLMHLSQLLFLSGIGIVVPIAMWLLGNEKSALVRQHGHRMMNWVVSSLIYAVVGFLLCFVFVGFFVIFVLGLLSIAFPIIAAIKCNADEVWTYPLTIKFFPED